MSTNLLAIFKQLFLKHLKDIKDIFTNVTTFVEDKDRAIAEFLSVEYPELIWLVRTLHIEYDKQYSPDILKQPQVVENIARSITLTVDETGTLDYGQQAHNNIVFNALETHLSKPQLKQPQEQPDNDDIISLEDSAPDMDFVYHHTTTFDDIAQSRSPSQSNHQSSPHETQTQHFSTIEKPITTRSADASTKIDRHSKVSDATVTPNSQHVTSKNADDVVDVAQLVNCVITSRGEQQKLSDSIHAPKRPSVINLSPSDLRHRLNQLRHKPTSERPGFLLVEAHSIPGYNRLEKINCITNIFQEMPGYVDLNWKYHDQSAAIIVEFCNHTHSVQAYQQIADKFKELKISIIDDLRQLLQRSIPSTPHKLRDLNPHQDHTQIQDQQETMMINNIDYDPSYRLRFVPAALSHQTIQSNLTYYGNIECIQEVEHLPPNRREIIITFDRYAKHSLLDNIWAVNIRGYNISIAKAHLNDSQLDYRKTYVVGFKGFHHKTTESQALRLLRPYGGMTCYFHQNFAYIAFKSEAQMQAVCNLRLYTDDDRLLTGRPRFQSRPDEAILSTNNNHVPKRKAMSTHTHDLPDLRYSEQPPKRAQTNKQR